MLETKLISKTPQTKLNWSEGSAVVGKNAPRDIRSDPDFQRSFTNRPKSLVGLIQEIDECGSLSSPQKKLAVYVISKNFSRPNPGWSFLILDELLQQCRLSDCYYAMGGKPIFAMRFWACPVEKLSPELAQKVMEGAKRFCKAAGIELAGGHAIAAKIPIFATFRERNSFIPKRSNSTRAKPEILIFFNQRNWALGY